MKILGIIKAFIRGGSMCLKPLEHTLINSVKNKLSSEDSSNLISQIQMISLVQRSHNNRMVLIFFNANKTLDLFHDKRESLCLANIKYEIKGEKFETKVFTHKGRMSSLETCKKLSSEDLLTIPTKIKVKTIFCEIHSLVEEINEEEHGHC